MARDCGWVEVLRERDGAVVARGRAVLRQVASRRPHDWRGALSPLRLADGTDSLRPATYLMRFEHSGDELRVRLRQHANAPVGALTAAAVRSADMELPLALGDHLLGGE